MNIENIDDLSYDLSDDYGYQYEVVIVKLTEQLCDIMVEQNISISQLAKRSGKSNRWIRDTLRGGKNIHFNEIVWLFWNLGYVIDINVSKK